MALTSEPSMQHGLELALQTLKMIPAHASREILLIIGSLTTCDAGDIHETVEVFSLINDLRFPLILFQYSRS